jgi:hypothetical protein
MKRFPIRDVQFHIEGLRQRNATTAHTDELHILTSWHSSAIAYLQFGAFHKLDGPGAERYGPDGSVTPARIEDYLTLAKGAKGESYLLKTFKKDDHDDNEPIRNIHCRSEISSPGRELARVGEPSNG